MQNDLISRKPLVDMLQGVEDDIFAEATRDVNQGKAFVSGVVQGVKNQVLALPAVDAVEVVRCRECIHRGDAHCPMRHEEYHFDEDDGADYVTHDYTDDDGYCDQGEKMDAKDMNVPTNDGGAE